MYIVRRFVAAALVLALSATAYATTLAIVLDIQGTGLKMAEGGVGLKGIGSGARTLSVDIGGPVQAALLYWVGRDIPCPTSGGTCVVPSQPYKDQILRFEGSLITGTIIGTEAQPVSASGSINNIGFLADVTSIVQAAGTGIQQFDIQDGDTASNLRVLDGAGLVVIYTDPTDTNTRRLIVFDGLDFAWGPDPTPGPTRVTVPITFNHGAATAARQGRLTIFAGDAESGRPDRIDISNNASLFNTLNASDGNEFDSDVHLINIPANVGSTTVQLFSTPNSSNPDSLLWTLGALELPLLPQQPAGIEGCTPGYWRNHTASWAGTGYSPGQTTGSVFSGAASFPTLAAKTLLQSLQGGGGSGTLGAAQILLRAAVAALLNAASPGVDYPLTTAQIIAQVNAALTSNSRTTMLSLAGALDADNNRGCPLN